MTVTVNGVHVEIADWPSAEMAAIHELLRQRAVEIGLATAAHNGSEDTDSAIEQLLAREVTIPDPTESECRRYYEAHRAEFQSGDIVHARHILFQVTAGAPVAAIRARAEQALHDVLMDPERFEALARELSNCPSGQHGGNLGQISRGDTVPEFERAIFRLDAEGILPSLVKTRYGFHIVAVDRTVAPRELIETITKAGHSRVPVYQGSIDRILGVLYVKDLLPLVIGSTRSIPLLDLIRPAFVVPESKKLDTLFAELKRAKIHIAIVADEYGGTAGLVTIEDILEEIVGEIQDEYDTELPLFEQTHPDVLLADGRLPIEDVEDALGVTFEEDENFATLGGFVHKHLGRLPIQGDVFDAEGVRGEILAVERHRVRRLRITRLPSPDLEEAHSGRRFGRGDSDRSNDDGQTGESGEDA